MGEYTPNSHKYREEQKNLPAERQKIEKVVSKTPKVKKSSLREFTENFIANDASNVGSYLGKEVLIPAFKNLLSDIVTDGINMLLYGESRRRGKGGSKATYVSYNDYSSDRRDSRRYSEDNRPRVGRIYEDVILDSRGDAEEVLRRMDEILETYTVVSVADFCDLVDISCPYTDVKYGWKDIRTAEVIRVRDGYKIKLPRAVVIDQEVLYGR